MSDFFSRPAFSHPYLAAGPVTAAVELIFSAYEESSPGNPSAPYSLDLIPLGLGVNGGTTTDTTTSADVTTASNAATAAASSASTAQGEVDTAHTAYTASLDAVQTAQDALDAGTDAYDQLLNVGVRQANIGLATANRSGDPARITAATAAVTAAQNAAATAGAALAPLQTNLASAQADSAGKLIVLGQKMQTANAAAGGSAVAALDLTLVQANYAASQASTPGASRDQFVLGTGGTVSLIGPPAVSQIEITQTANPDPESDDPYFVTTTRTGKYALRVTLDDATYQAALASGLHSLPLEWSEVNTVLIAPDQEPTVTFTPKSETLALDAGVQATSDYGATIWRWQTSVYLPTAASVPAPVAGDYDTTTSSVTISGVPLQPSLAVAVMQCRGAQRQRQGWSEWTTPATATQANRYLTLSASGGGAAGTVALALPPDGDPAPGQVIRPGDYNPPQQPLVIYDTTTGFNAAKDDPNLLTAPTDHATVTSPTERTLTDPAGITLALSNAQTPAAIAADADAVAGVDWPADDANPVLPQTGFAGAIKVVAATGDLYAAQKMRYKLTHTANDSRQQAASTFTTTSRWEVHTRDLLTGVVTVESFTEDRAWPNLADPDGYNSLWVYTDTDWREVAVPGDNQSVELVLLAGTNADPRTFGSLAVSLSADLPDDDPGG